MWLLPSVATASYILFTYGFNSYLWSIICVPETILDARKTSMSNWENVLESMAIFVAGWAGGRQQTDVRRREEF